MEMQREDIKTEWEKPSDNPLQDLTNDQIKELLAYRSEKLMEVGKHYKAFVEAIYTLPIHVVYRQNSFMNIDQGWHWVEAGINNVWVTPKPQNEEVKNVDPCVESCVEHSHETH